jgi:hypothetical protein
MNPELLPEHLQGQTLDSIYDSISTSLQRYISCEKIKSIQEKLTGYRYIDELYQLQRGKHVRWIRFKELRTPLDIANSYELNSYELRSPEFQGVAESEGRSKSAIFGRDAVSYENPRTPSAARPEYFTRSPEYFTVRSKSAKGTFGRRDENPRTKMLITTTPTLTIGGVVVDIKIMDSGIHILCKNGSRYIQFKFDECMIYQKLSTDELLLLSALRFVDGEHSS